jgi:hypothetical protein
MQLDRIKGMTTNIQFGLFSHPLVGGLLGTWAGFSFPVWVVALDSEAEVVCGMDGSLVNGDTLVEVAAQRVEHPGREAPLAMFVQICLYNHRITL